MRSLLSIIDVADQPLLDSARRFYDRDLNRRVNQSIVRSVNAEHGTDFTTAVLYAHFESRVPEFDACRRRDAKEDSKRPLLVAIVPGAFYEEHPETGADGRDLISLSAEADWQAERIQTLSLGAPRENAEEINAFLKRKLPTYRIVLVSLSKGTLDAETARSMNPSVFEQLSGWVSVSGIPHGTRMADWLLDRWLLRPILELILWRHGADRQAVRSMRHQPGIWRNSRTPADFPMIHISAFPLQRHLSCRRSRLWYSRFKGSGPNDGVVMLEDLLQLHGIVIPIWGADHYLQGEWDVPRAVANIVAWLDGNELAEEERVA